MLLVRIVLEQIVGDPLNWVSWSLLGTLSHSLEQDRSDCLVNLCSGGASSSSLFLLLNHINLIIIMIIEIQI